MLEVLNFRPGDHERKKLKVDSLNSPKSRKILEEKYTEEGVMDALGAEIEGVIQHIEMLSKPNFQEEKFFIHKTTTQ